MFHTLLLLCLFLWHVVGVFDVDPDKVKSVSVMEGDSVTLHTDLTQIQDKDVIEWWFESESEDILIARIKREIGVFSTSDDVLDGRFRGRLHLNHQTGDLTITNITTEHTGLYELNIFTGNELTIKTFSVTVSEDYLYGCGCGSTEAVIRLVISGLVAVATVAVLV